MKAIRPVKTRVSLIPEGSLAALEPSLTRDSLLKTGLVKEVGCRPVSEKLWTEFD